MGNKMQFELKFLIYNTLFTETICLHIVFGI